MQLLVWAMLPIYLDHAQYKNLEFEVSNIITTNLHCNFVIWLPVIKCYTLIELWVDIVSYHSGGGLFLLAEDNNVRIRN